VRNKVFRDRKQESKRKYYPPAVDEIADFLRWRAAIFSIFSIPGACIWLFLLIQLGTDVMFFKLGELTIVVVLVNAFSAFLWFLARDFRRLRKWTYGYAEFICMMSSWPLSKGLTDKFRQKGVLEAFGQDEESSYGDKD
jgi:hypothetical protein